MANFMDNLIGWTGAIGTILLLLWGTHTDAFERGRNQAFRSFECPRGTAYTVVKQKEQEVKCIPWGMK